MTLTRSPKATKEANEVALLIAGATTVFCSNAGFSWQLTLAVGLLMMLLIVLIIEQSDTL